MTREELINFGEMFLEVNKDSKNSSTYEFVDAAVKLFKQEPCEDVISRQAVIDGINKYFHDEYYQRTSIRDCMDCLIEDVIKNVPPVTSQPKMGKWEHGRELSRVFIGNALRGINYEDWHCSNCHCVVEQSIKPKWSYCPSCGAKMESEE